MVRSRGGGGTGWEAYSVSVGNEGEGEPLKTHLVEEDVQLNPSYGASFARRVTRGSGEERKGDACADGELVPSRFRQVLLNQLRSAGVQPQVLLLKI